MSAWDGKSKAGTFGYRILIFVLRTFGLKPTYFVLRFVSFYYFVFSSKSNKALHDYFGNRLGWNKWKRFFAIYKNYFVFAQTLVDRVAIQSGLASEFTYNFTGEENLVQLIEGEKGGILLGAHIGNWEIAGYLLKRLKKPINILVYEDENENVKKTLDEAKGKNQINYISMKSDLSHIYSISAALQKGELICMHADRFLPNSKTLTTDFLQKEARFPQGPFALSVSFKVPVTFVYAMKKNSLHYDLSSTKPKIYNDSSDKQKLSQKMLDDFAKATEKVLTQYPLQWFNYYNFWKA